MEPIPINPPPPHFENLEWRHIHPNDLDAVVVLAQDGFQVDGGLGFLFEPDVIQGRYFPDEAATGIGAFTPDGNLAACTAVSLVGDPGSQRARIVGQVRPDLRSKGIGTYLMRWSQARAQDLLTGVCAASGVLQVATESLTEPSHHLYLANGFQSVFEELVMERDLRLPLPDHPLPPDVTITDWRPELAGQFFQAYQAAFRERPGFPGYSAEEWITQVSEDDHKPEWSLLARMEGVPVGFVNADVDLTSNPPGGYISQIGVVPAQRRRGIGSALLVETIRRMQAESAHTALLAVHLNNPGAIRAYTALGFETVGRRARYERLAK